jgi:hypothetical protein
MGTKEDQPFHEALVELRGKRNRLLTESDWVITKAKEEETEIPEAWKEYRKKLRDLPAEVSKTKEIRYVDFVGVINVDWPKKPE